MKQLSTNRMIEELHQKASEARNAAKALQRKLQETTDPEERKQLARQMNDLFNVACRLKNEAKHRHDMEECIEREFISIHANLEDD